MSTLTNTSPNPSRPGRGGWFGTIFVALLAAAAGLYVGSRWHTSFQNLLGMSATPDDATTHAAVAGAPRQLWTCSMHPQVIQEKAGMCPICHMQLTSLNLDAGSMDAGHDRAAAAPTSTSPVGAATAPPTTATQDRQIKYWWDPMMSPPYISDKPGKSPMGMDLVPVYESEVSAGTPITIDPVIVQNMGVRLAAVTLGPLRRDVRAVGLIEQPQPRLYDINLRVSGWVERLYADTEGMPIKKGDPLFDLYSPDVLVAIEELISARRAVEQSGDDAAGMDHRLATMTADASARKLELWGIDRQQIERFAGLEHAPRSVTFVSPVTGELSEKMIVEGASVMAGERVLQLADRSVVWLDAKVFTHDLPFVALNQAVTATVESFPGMDFVGRILFIHPRVDDVSRTALVRIELDNSNLLLRPGMFAVVHTSAQTVDHALLIPDEAVIDTGERQVVFVSLGRGRFEPRSVRMGPANADGTVQVLQGLVGGEMVVTSGQFLLDAESRIREAIRKYVDRNAAVQQDQTPPSESNYEH